MSRFIFPEWTESLKKWVLLLAAGAPVYLIMLVAYGVTPEAIRIGYMPEQPVPYSHALHVGELGLDCRYCHNTVDKAGFSAVPPAATCMNCHGNVREDSPKLLPVRESYATGEPVQWVKVHDAPDYVYFNHSAHVTRGVGCESCHGRIDQMVEVWQASSLTMGWCLDCHRNPAPNLRDPADVTVMGFDERFETNEARVEYGRKIQQQYNLKPNTNCSTCHR
ncbi:MAG: cytochrome c family protein [Deltaproteobacteria bacterium]|nr:cytochrome c family protein [Deltaproteobacteria bacterium]